MKIAYNPQTGAALTAVPSDNNNDIVFDLSGLAIYAKGVRFDGRSWTIFKKHTNEDNSGGYAGLVPAPSYTTTTTRFLREDGLWTEISNITSDIVTLKNYSIATTASSLADKDTLNTALGKLEYRINSNEGLITNIKNSYVTLATNLEITGIKTFTQLITASGFVKNNSSNEYVLLGGGGHKSLNDFLLETEFANKELVSNVATVTKSLKVTSSWIDTGITSDTLSESGTYIVLVFVNANNSSDNMWSCYWSGIMSWYKGNTNDADQYEEILLHRAGHAYNNTIYLRTAAGSGNVPLLLLIASNTNMINSYTFTFKFKRVL